MAKILKNLGLFVPALLFYQFAAPSVSVGSMALATELNLNPAGNAAKRDIQDLSKLDITGQDVKQPSNVASKRPPLDRSPSSVFYESAVVFGNPDAKRSLVFYWTAVDEKSLTEFRLQVVPIASKGKNTNLRIVFYQIFDQHNHDLVGPGAYLLCYDKYSDYLDTAIDYLLKASKPNDVKFEPSTGLYSNNYIRGLIKRKKLKADGCKTSNFMTRQVLLLQKSKEYYSMVKPKKFPIYIIDGKIHASDESFFQDVLKSANNP